jgi:hypothetical protein
VGTVLYAKNMSNTSKRDSSFMIKLQPNRQPELGETARRPRPRNAAATFRRRGMGRILVISGFIVAVVWIINYAGAAGDVIQAFREKGQRAPFIRLLDPLLAARSCPTALAMLLAILVGFFALLRVKAARKIERRVLWALGAVGWTAGSVRHSQDGLGGPSYNRDGFGGPSYRAERSWPWIALGLAIVAASIALLEWLEPCYFVQDDNFANVLPGILHGCRTMFRGEFPDFDPCQYMGMPSAGLGLNAIFYPPTIIAYAVARWGLGNENWTLEVFAALHLLGGYVASYAAARKAGLRPALAFALGISFALSGYVLLVGRGWFAVLTLVLWLPLLFCAMEAWFHGRTGWRWLLTSGLAIGGFYYMGFPQYWVYTMLFLAAAAAAVVAGGRVAARELRWPAAAGLLGLALILPTLVVQLEITRGMQQKPANFGMDFQNGLLATMAPYPLSRAEGFMIVPANRNRELENQMYFAGTILIAGGYVVLGALLAYRCNRRWLAANPWTVAAAASLWLGLGSAGLLWTVLGRLPVIRAVNHHPHRLLPFFVFFALVIGGRFIERLLRRANSRKWEYAIAAATAGLMLYHVCLCRTSLWCYGDRPYPPLPREIAQRISPDEDPQAGRITWLGPWRSGLPGYAWLAPHSLPSAYGVLAIGGYDPIVENRPETLAVQSRCEDSPLEAARAYGVRWILAANSEHYWPERNYWQAVYNHDWCIGYMHDPSADNRNAEALLPAARLCVQRDELRLYELSGACPLAFDRANPAVSLPIRFRGWGAEVESPGGKRTIVVNMAMRPWVRAAAGSELLPTVADEWGRVEVRVPTAITRFQVFYQLPWRRGLLLGGGLAMATLAVMFWFKIGAA